MPWRPFQSVVVTICLLPGHLLTYAQQPAIAEINTEIDCPRPSASANEKTSSPEITIVDVSFSGSLELPVSDQEQIAASVKQQNYGNSSVGVIDEALERVKKGWQDRGYFKVEASADARTLTSSPAGQRIALTVHVDEGVQYRLRKMTFKPSGRIIDVGILRGLFPIKDGDVFSRSKVAAGLENLRNAYGELGYVNFTSIPNTAFDDESKMADLNIEFAEGKQFRVGSVNILGLDESAQGELLEEFPMKRGEVYDQTLFSQFQSKNASRFAPLTARDLSKLDEKEGLVALTLDFRSCSE
jgi:outer membrane protein assembly factor BamA